MNRTLLSRYARLGLAASLVTAFAACSKDDDGPGEGTGDGIVTPPTGATSFISADGLAGQQTQEPGRDGDDAGAPSEDAGNGGGEERTVEEGDIYRLLDGGRIVNLNAYRGLQVIDVSDVSDPRVIGRLPESGSPVELYVVGDRAIVLLNNWTGYYGSRADVTVSSAQGGLVLSVDLSDPTNPQIVDRDFIPGSIITSRLARLGDTVALYVATSEYGYYETADGSSTWETRSFVKSFDVSGGDIVSQTQLDLGGYVMAIQATPEALMVARQNWNEWDGRTSVALIDISDPNGAMVEGEEVVAAGYIDNKYNMDFYNGVLRIVSGANWGGTRTNTVETFDASDFSNLEPIDECTFGDNENLFATLFLGNKAFFVTYLRVDPFHAFEITDEGNCIEHNEYVVSGWNEFFRPVLDETRLIGIGVDDAAGGQTLAVSLYDITDLTEPEPMLARASVDAEWGWSEALWDDRAFSVIEDAVEVTAADGTAETGLVLLPYTGYDSEMSSYQAGVQLYTFSATTLTRRGSMIQGSPVRRSFLADDDVTANLGDAELTLFDTSNPDAPDELGRTDLAPNFTDILRFGDYGARVRGSDWYGYGSGAQYNRVEIVPLSENTDRADAIASFDIPLNASLKVAGDSLVVTSTVWIASTEDGTNQYETTFTIYDLSDPTAPELASTFTTRELNPSWGGYYYGGRGGMAEDCWDCGGWWGYSSGPEAEAAGDAVVFLEREYQQEFLYREQVCNVWANEYERCEPGETPEGEPTEEICTYINGYQSCVTPEGGEEVCTGSFSRCTYSSEGGYTCVPVDISEVTITERYCYDNDRYRYWTSFDLHVLDLSNPAEASLSDAIELPVEDQGVGILADEDRVWVSFRRPVEVEGDSRPYARYFIRALDVSDPAAPLLGGAINVPGELIEVDGDDVYTRDTLWGERIVDTAVARLQISGGLAYLQAVRRFEDEEVHSIQLDGAGNLLVSHRLSWYATAPDAGGGAVPDDSDAGGSDTDTDDTEETTPVEPMQTLTILDASTLAVQASEPIDSWAELQSAKDGRALFSVPGGLLVVNLDNPAAPYAQAWFATQAWPWNIRVEDGVIRFAAGRYGIYEFDVDTFNLLAPM